MLLAQACEVIFLMDQDSDIEDTFFTDMMEVADGLGTDTFLIGPRSSRSSCSDICPLFLREVLPKANSH